jgi:hypothetical protein
MIEPSVADGSSIDGQLQSTIELLLCKQVADWMRGARQPVTDYVKHQP